MPTRTSYRNRSGRTVHLNERGNCTGVSQTSASGYKTTHYDASGGKTGTSCRNAAGNKLTHYDAEGRMTGVTWINSHGGMTHYDANGRKVSQSVGNSAGVYTHAPADRTGEYRPPATGRLRIQPNRRIPQPWWTICILLGILGWLLVLSKSP